MNTKIKPRSKNAQRNRSKAKKQWNKNFRHKSKMDFDITNPKRQISNWD